MDDCERDEKSRISTRLTDWRIGGPPSLPQVRHILPMFRRAHVDGPMWSHIRRYLTGCLPTHSQHSSQVNTNRRRRRSTGGKRLHRFHFQQRPRYREEFTRVLGTYRAWATVAAVPMELAWPSMPWGKLNFSNWVTLHLSCGLDHWIYKRGNSRNSRVGRVEA